MKIQNIPVLLLLPALMMFNLTLSAQQIATLKGDKIPLSDLQVEPWRVERTADKATSNTQNIYQNAHVGVGDFGGKTTTKQLEVDGGIKGQKAFVTDMQNADNTRASEYATVVMDTRNGELLKTTNTSDSKPISYIVFDVTTKVGSDYVKELDTKIPSSEYTVLLINAIFDSPLALQSGKYMAPFTYAATVKDGKWMLTADYTAVSPSNTSKTNKWKLICLVIQNSQIQDLQYFSRSLGSDDTGGMDNLEQLRSGENKL